MMITLLPVIAAAVVALAPTKPLPPPATSPTATKPSTPPTYPGASLYRIEGQFEDANGVGGLDVARGGPALVAMFYATCPMACPLLINDIKRVLAGLTEADRASLRVVLISLQPAIDTPKVLGSVQQERHLDAPAWTLLRTDQTTTRTVAAALGVRWRENDDGSIDHSSKILLVDGDGVVIATRDAIGSPATEFVKAIHAAPPRKHP